MNFDLIDELSDSNVSMLYNETVYNIDNNEEYIARCDCINLTYGFVRRFGGSRYGCIDLQNRGIYNATQCRNWCRSLNFDINAFYRACYCTYTGVFGSQDGNNFGYVWNCTSDLPLYVKPEEPSVEPEEPPIVPDNPDEPDDSDDP